MIEVIGTRYVAGKRQKAFKEQVSSFTSQGFVIIRKPQHEEEPYILAIPSQVIVTYNWFGEEREDDLKREIKKAYNRYYSAHSKKTISNFTKKSYERFVEDLEEHRIVAYPNKFNGPDIWFKVIY